MAPLHMGECSPLLSSEMDFSDGLTFLLRWAWDEFLSPLTPSGQGPLKTVPDRSRYSALPVTLCECSGLEAQCNQKLCPTLWCIGSKAGGWLSVYNRNRYGLLYESCNSRNVVFLCCMDQTISNRATPVWMGRELSSGHLGSLLFSRSAKTVQRG